MPMPAITACSMVSLLDISITTHGTTRCAAKQSSIAFRVPDPCSRAIKSWCEAAGAFGPRVPSSGWSGAQAITTGCAPNG